MLDEVYPIVYMNSMHFKAREDSKIISKAEYIYMYGFKYGREK